MSLLAESKLLQCSVSTIHPIHSHIADYDDEGIQLEAKDGCCLNFLLSKSIIELTPTKKYADSTSG